MLYNLLLLLLLYLLTARYEPISLHVV